MRKSTYNIFIEGNPESIRHPKGIFDKKIKSSISQFRKEHLITGDVSVKLVFWLKKEKGNLANERKDLDNLVKNVLDSLNGVFYEDDRQVTEICAKKEFNDSLEGITLWLKG